MAYVIFFIVFNILLIVLQVFLAKNKKRIVGLIIPIFNLLLALSVALFSSPYTTTTTDAGTGLQYLTNNFGTFIGGVILIFVLLSIPAFINFIIYFVQRSRIKKKNQNEILKMKINDLN